MKQEKFIQNNHGKSSKEDAGSKISRRKFLKLGIMGTTGEILRSKIKLNKNAEANESPEKETINQEAYYYTMEELERERVQKMVRTERKAKRTLAY